MKICKVKKCVCTEYLQTSDRTIIFEDTYKGDDLTSTRIIGFYYGKPNEEDTQQFAGKLKAKY